MNQPFRRRSSQPSPSFLYPVPDRAVGRATYLPGVRRSLELVDHENLQGGPFAPDHCIAEAARAFRSVRSRGPYDHSIVAVNPELLLKVGPLWPGALLKTRAGRDGADLALLEAASDITWIAKRYDQVIIGSGDAIFLPLVRDLQNLGVPVGVVARVGCVSAELRWEADFFSFLPGISPILEAA